MVGFGCSRSKIPPPEEEYVYTYTNTNVAGHPLATNRITASLSWPIIFKYAGYCAERCNAATGKSK
jgi:hypothetical protein